MTKGVLLQPQSSSPIPSGQNGIWADSSNHLQFTNTSGGNSNLSSVGGSNASQITNGTGSTIAALMPVSIDGSGNAQLVDVTSSSSSLGFFGITSASVASSAVASVVTAGEITSITTLLPYGSPLYVYSDGTLTNTQPGPGTPGFSSGSWILKAGHIKKNPTTGLKDLVVCVSVLGQIP